MSAVLFAAHNDDEVLWTFYNLLRHRPKVIIVFRSFSERDQGGPAYFEREHETELAMRVAGVEWEQWSYPDNLEPDLFSLAHDIREAVDGHDLIIGPAWEPGGHHQHNDIAINLDGYKDTEMIRYTSYVRGHGRTETPNEIIPTAEERILKDVALACYQSQAEWPPTKPWFDPSDQREFVL